MLALAFRNLSRRRLRSLLALTGLSLSIGLLACLLAFGQGYRQGLERELNGMGMQMMLVPLGCPYDAAARVLKGKTLDVSLPATALQTARNDAAVAVAAPVLMATVPRPSEGRTDLWVGIDSTIRPLKPWWKFKAGSGEFPNENSVILGAEAAATELRQVGDTLYSPETNRRFIVSGILERSGTSDDSVFFIPLQTAQAMFGQKDRITAVAIRLKDPMLTSEATDRLQTTPGAQVVTLAEMTGTFRNLVGAAKTLALALALTAIAVSALSVFNTMLSASLERTSELGVMRAVGASRFQIFRLMALESVVLTLLGSALGIGLAFAAGRFVEVVIRRLLPFAPEQSLLALTGPIVLQCAGIGLVLGLLAGLYPAFRASRLQPALALRVE